MKLRFKFFSLVLKNRNKRNELGIIARTFTVDSPLKRVQTTMICMGILVCHCKFSNKQLEWHTLYCQAAWPLFWGGLKFDSEKELLREMAEDWGHFQGNEWPWMTHEIHNAELWWLQFWRGVAVKDSGFIYKRKNNIDIHRLGLWIYGTHPKSREKVIYRIQFMPNWLIDTSNWKFAPWTHPIATGDLGHFLSEIIQHWLHQWWMEGMWYRQRSTGNPWSFCDLPEQRSESAHLWWFFTVFKQKTLQNHWFSSAKDSWDAFKNTRENTPCDTRCPTLWSHKIFIFRHIW